MSDALFSEVRRKLNITWEDTETNARISDIIANMRPVVARLCGHKDDEGAFGVSGAERTLLVNACLYEFNHQFDEFKAAYADDILAARIANAIGGSHG